MINLFKLSPKIYLIITIAGITVLTFITGAIFLLALNFDGIEFNGDSHVYFNDARHFLTAITEHISPRPSHWPYGYPAILSLAFAIGDISFESARWVNVFLGGLLVTVLCFILLLISDIKKLSINQSFLIVLTVGLLPLGHGLFIKYQISMMSDMTAAFLSSLMMLLCWRWRMSGYLIDIFLAGVALGVLMSTRYVYSLMFIPGLSVVFFDIDLQQTRSVYRRLFPAFLFVASALLAFAPQLSITLQDTSSSLGNELLKHWSINNFFSLTHESVDGHTSANVPSVLCYFILPFRLQCFTPLGIILAALGIIYAFRELPKWLWPSIIIWYLIFYILLCGLPLQNGRIGFPLFLPITLWMSLGLLECLIRWKNLFNKILVLVSLTWCLSLAFSSLSIQRFIKMKSDLKVTAESLAKAVPAQSRIISTSLYPVYNAYPMDVKALSIYQMSISEAENLFSGNHSPLFLAIDEDFFIPRWSNYPPGKCFYWIRNNYSCTYKSKIDDYTVYEIKPCKKLLP